MSFTEPERRHLLTIIPGLTFGTNGDPLLPTQVDPEQIAHGVNYVEGLKKQKLLAYNFLVGALIAKIPKTRGSRAEFCRQHFGADRVDAMRGVAWTFEEWSPISLHVPKWGYSHYHESAGASQEMKREFVERNRVILEETGKPLPISLIREECSRMKQLHRALETFESNVSPGGRFRSTMGSTYIVVERKEGRYQADTETGAVTPLYGAPELPESQKKALAAYARCCPGIETEDEYE